MTKSLTTLSSLQGRRSIVTGACGHIGRVISHTLAELGSDLILLDLNEQNLNMLANEITNKYLVSVDVYACDFEYPRQVKETLSILKEKYSSINVLINNAAFVGTSGLDGWSVEFNKQSVDTWRRALEVNLTSVFTIVQGLSEVLSRSGNASIINIGSIYGVYGPDPSLYQDLSLHNPAAYAASKGGLIQLTRWLATTLAPFVRVNSISPGGIFRNQPEEFVDRYSSKTPLGRMGTEEDIKGAIMYLATDLSNWVTGQNVLIDGGWGTW